MSQAYDSKNYKSVYNYVMTLCGNESAAQEITQSVFFNAAHSRRTEWKTDADYEAWLLSLAKEELINYRVAHKTDTAADKI